MKLRTKIVLLAILPALFVSISQYISSMEQLDKGTLQEAYEGMQGTAVMTNYLLDSLGDGAYQLKGEELCKGDFNLSQNGDFFDDLNEKSGYDATLILW